MIDRHRPNNVHSNIPLVACLAGVFIREVYLSPMIFSLCSKSPQGWCDAELILSSVDDFSSGTVFLHVYIRNSWPRFLILWSSEPCLCSSETFAYKNPSTSWYPFSKRADAMSPWLCHENICNDRLYFCRQSIQKAWLLAWCRCS